MKTKEIEVWVSRPLIDNDIRFGESRERYIRIPYRDHDLSEQGYTKAKLIIELPEKKIEITEGQFDEAVKEFFKGDISPMQTGVKMQSHLKQKLFGDVSERLGERT